MDWNTHSNLKDAHAFLSPSGHHWLNYDHDKLMTVYLNMKAKDLGTRLHAQAANDIELQLRRPNNNKTLNRYVNDGIDYRMNAEKVLYYSPFCFGTADSISFRREKKKGKYVLRIHDLKTGTIPASMKQLYIYAALFFLEYGPKYMVEPEDVEIYLAIYQNDDVQRECPAAEDIHDIMNKIVELDNILRNEV